MEEKEERDLYGRIKSTHQDLFSSLFGKPKVDGTYFTTNYSSPLGYLNISTETSNKVKKLQLEIEDKENQNKKLFEEVKKLKLEKINATEKIEEFEKNNEHILKNQKLINLTSKIHVEAARIIFDDTSELRKNFTLQDEISMAVLSIDIRRSTDLMLNAKNSEKFAFFISGLCEGLKEIVIDNYGVFDKFTGDGILAYFPEFYSGEKPVHSCCITANLCHKYFADYYKEYRDCFNINIKTGLGIGIDYGDAKIVRINDEPTIVGVPVVYACRLSCAPAGHTYINQSAFECLNKNEVKYYEKDVNIKIQGDIIIYDFVEIVNAKTIKPSWHT